MRRSHGKKLRYVKLWSRIAYLGEEDVFASKRHLHLSFSLSF